MLVIGISFTSPLSMNCSFVCPDSEPDKQPSLLSEVASEYIHFPGNCLPGTSGGEPGAAADPAQSASHLQRARRVQQPACKSLDGHNYRARAPEPTLTFNSINFRRI